MIAALHDLQDRDATDERGYATKLAARNHREWAFLIINRITGTLWAGCDPFGTKPLRCWISENGETIILASEAKAMFPLGVPADLDEDALRFSTFSIPALRTHIVPR